MKGVAIQAYNKVEEFAEVKDFNLVPCETRGFAESEIAANLRYGYKFEEDLMKSALESRVKDGDTFEVKEVPEPKFFRSNATAYPYPVGEVDGVDIILFTEETAYDKRGGTQDLPQNLNIGGYDLGNEDFGHFYNDGLFVFGNVVLMGYDPEKKTVCDIPNIKEVVKDINENGIGYAFDGIGEVTNQHRFEMMNEEPINIKALLETESGELKPVLIKFKGDIYATVEMPFSEDYGGRSTLIELDFNNESIGYYKGPSSRLFVKEVLTADKKRYVLGSISDEEIAGIREQIRDVNALGTLLLKGGVQIDALAMAECALSDQSSLSKRSANNSQYLSYLEKEGIYPFSDNMKVNAAMADVLKTINLVEYSEGNFEKKITEKYKLRDIAKKFEEYLEGKNLAKSRSNDLTPGFGQKTVENGVKR